VAFFGKKDEGGLLDVIRCDEEEYLIWKWSPSGNANSTVKENSIRWGSSLRVKDGEVAVFVYKQKDGPMQDFIEGPFDDVIKTANFPIISNIIGLAYAGQSPFQAEIYFINLSGNVRRPFGIPYFNVGDPRYPDFVVPVRANGSFTFNITDYKAFIKLHRLINFDLEQFSVGVRDAVVKRVKGVISRAPQEAGIPVVRLNQQIDVISDLLQDKIRDEFVNDFGVNLKRFDLSSIEVDESSEAYNELASITKLQQTRMIDAQTDVSVDNLRSTQVINAENMAETLRIQRKGAELQAETQFIGAHQINQQTSVLTSAANNLGQMSQINTGGGSGGGFNPVGVMTGLAVGGAMGGQMANMMNATAQNMPMPGSMPPPIPQISYTLSINGQNAGPFNLQQLQEMIRNGQLKADTFAWKPGMPNWESAGSITELAQLFASMTPPPPPPPPPPMTPTA